MSKSHQFDPAEFKKRLEADTPKGSAHLAILRIALPLLAIGFGLFLQTDIGKVFYGYCFLSFVEAAKTQ
jgi:hypothetical protein